MNKLVKCFIFSSSLFFVANAFSQALNAIDGGQIESQCRSNNESNLSVLRSYGDNFTTSEQLLAKCIKSSTAVSAFHRSNKMQSIQELYDQTVIKLEAKLRELKYLNSIELNEQYNCYIVQYIALYYARSFSYQDFDKKNFDKNFLRMAIITANNLLDNGCNHFKDNFN